MKSVFSLLKPACRFGLFGLIGVLLFVPASCSFNGVKVLDADKSGGHDALGDGRLMEPQLGRCLEYEFINAWLDKGDRRGAWRANCFLIFESEPSYRIVEGTLSIKADDGKKSCGNKTRSYSPNDGAVKGLTMHVTGNVLVERTRTNALFNVLLFRLVTWKTDPAYMRVPLDFTYVSSWNGEPANSVAAGPVKR